MTQPIVCTQCGRVYGSPYGHTSGICHQCENHNEFKENQKEREGMKGDPTTGRLVGDKAGSSAAEATRLKTLHNSDASGAKQNVPDLTFFGDGDTFKLLCKASSEKEGWMKSTKAMAIPGLGSVVQITTQQGDNVSEAACYVPGATVVDERDIDGKVIGRYLTPQSAGKYVGLVMEYMIGEDVCRGRVVSDDFSYMLPLREETEFILLINGKIAAQADAAVKRWDVLECKMENKDTGMYKVLTALPLMEYLQKERA